jgi:hypothetical protein
MAELQLPKLIARVRFPSSAPRDSRGPTLGIVYNNPQLTAHFAPRVNVLAMCALIAAFFVPPVAIVLGHIALHELSGDAQNAPVPQTGRGIAITGLVIGYLGTVVLLVAVAALVVWLGALR